MRWSQSQRLIVTFMFCFETPKAGARPANCWTVPSLASSLHSVTNLSILLSFRCSALTVTVLFLVQYHFYVQLLVGSSTQCSWRWWLWMFRSRFQWAFRHAGTEGCYRYSTVNIWEWVANATSRPLYPLERAPAPIVEEAGWAPGSVCMAWGWENVYFGWGSKPEQSRLWQFAGIRYPDPIWSGTCMRSVGLTCFPNTLHVHAFTLSGSCQRTQGSGMSRLSRLKRDVSVTNPLFSSAFSSDQTRRWDYTLCNSIACCVFERHKHTTWNSFL